jgi:RNA polymerase sigma-70 factor (ECF subfamily)
MAKASPEEIELHNLLLSKDETAFAKLCDKYLEPTIKALRQYYFRIHRIDDSLIPEIVIDSFYAYAENPKKYDPEKRSLAQFLKMDAAGDLINAWARRTRSMSKLTPIKDDLEADPLTPDGRLINAETAAILQAELQRLFEDERDMEIADLILSKKRDTTAYAKILKIAHLPFEEQQQEVKRHKDRIKKVLDRNLKGKPY